MGNDTNWLSVVIFIVVCTIYYYFVSKFGDVLAVKIEEMMWGERYHRKSILRRRTYRHYSVILAIVFSIWVGIKTHSSVTGFIVFAITSILFYTGWRIMEDVLEKTVDKGVDSIGGVIGTMKNKREMPSRETEASQVNEQKNTKASAVTLQAKSVTTQTEEATMKTEELFCMYCGKKIRIDASFCPFCGKDIRNMKT